MSSLGQSTDFRQAQKTPVNRMSSRRLAVVSGLIIGTLVQSGLASAHTPTGSCTVDFDNNFALTNIYANARATFAEKTGFHSTGKLIDCAHSVNPSACWTYRHRCATNYVNVDDDPGTSHWHLSFTNSGYNPVCGFFDPNDGYGGGFKRTISGTCQVVDWKTEPRKLISHVGEEWIAITMASQAGATTVFDLSRIQIGGTTPVQIWFHSTLDGNWYFWPSLSPNNWSTIGSSHDVDIVKISGASGSLPYEVVDFDILD